MVMLKWDSKSANIMQAYKKQPETEVLIVNKLMLAFDRQPLQNPKHLSLNWSSYSAVLTTVNYGKTSRHFSSSPLPKSQNKLTGYQIFFPHFSKYRSCCLWIIFSVVYKLWFAGNWAECMYQNRTEKCSKKPFLQSRTKDTVGVRIVLVCICMCVCL